MKTLISLILTQLVFISLFSQSTLTVNNNPGSVANGTTTFTDLQAAIDYASAGDVIYVAGSPTSYGDANITKQLNIIGEGYKIDYENGIEETSKVNIIRLQVGSSNTTIEGLNISGIWGYEDETSSTRNITIRNNAIHTLVVKHRNYSGEQETGWLIQNNIIFTFMGTYSASTNIGSIQIINNIFHYSITKLNSPNSIIEFNLFTRNGIVISGVTDVTFSSNIFYTSDITGCSRCSFYNNLVYNPFNQTDLTFSYDNNIADNTNLENVNPTFTELVTDVFHWDNDYHLLPASPALTAGPNGTEIGIYSEEGSPFGDKPGPDIPIIKELKIDDRMIEAGQQLQIQVKAEN